MVDSMTKVKVHEIHGFVSFFLSSSFAGLLKRSWLWFLENREAYAGGRSSLDLLLELEPPVSAV
jgi:hypothetical protein